MLIFRYKAILGLLFVKILNCESTSLFGGGVVGALGAKPAWHIAAHHANFWAGAFANAIDFAALRKRSGRRGAECLAHKE